MKKIFAALLFSTLALCAEEEVSSIILGGGVGAYTSAVYLSRAGIVPYVVEGPTPGGTITQSPNVQNWPGEMAISGFELSEKVRNQALANGARLLSEEVVGVDFSKRPFEITLRAVDRPDKTRKILAKTCIIALGSQPNYLGVEGEKKYWSHGVYNCAICDGTLYRDKTVVVVGGGDAAILEADYLSNIAKKVIVLVRKGAFRTVEENRKNQLMLKPNVQVVFNSHVKEILGDGAKVTELLVQGKNGVEHLPTDALFLAIGSTPNSQLFRHQLKLDENGYIIVDARHQTSVDGVYAIGDIADPLYKQAISAAGKGAEAAIEVQKQLTKIVRPVVKTVPASTPIHQNVTEVQSVEQFQALLKESAYPVLVDFYATWCPPCKRFSPVFDGWAKEHKGKYTFLKVNADQVRELCDKYQITALPTLAVINQQGQLQQRYVGGQEIGKFADQLQNKQVATNH